MTEIPNKTDGEVLNAADLTKILTTTETVTSASGATFAEAEIGELVVGASEVSQGILILAHVKATTNQRSSSGAATVVIRIRVGESGTATSNTLVDTFTLSLSQTYGGDIYDSQVAINFDQTIHAIYTGATWTNANNVHITAQGTSGAGSSNSAECVKVTVVGI